MNGLRRLRMATTICAALAAGAAAAEGHVGFSAVALQDLEFQPIGDLPIQLAVLWGNPGEGEVAVMLKFPPNFPGGMHSHTSAYHGLVISGGSRHWVEGASEADAPLMRPGDYWYQAGGQTHQDSFPTDEETILFLKFEGPMDTIFAD